MGNGRYAHLPLAHRRVMVLEDDFLVRNGLEATLEKAGAMISSLYHPRLEAAILDVAMGRGPSSAQVARELSRRGIPFFFYTGQPDDVLEAIRAEWPDTVVMAKPAPPEAILQTLFDLLTGARGRLVPLGRVNGPPMRTRQ
jgi:DNA-binding NarL/FixJ family response regulator